MLTIRCTLLRDVFEGSLPNNPRMAEWPPSWMRVFSALVSVASPESDDDDVLERLESAEPPIIYASEVVRSIRAAFVPTNKRSAKAYANLPGRTSLERLWARTIPRNCEVWYRWHALALTDGQRERLDQLCKRVPYLGRSTSPAILEVSDQEPADLRRLVPRPASSESEVFEFSDTVRCPYEGSLKALREAYEQRIVLKRTGNPWEIGIGVDYGITRPIEPASFIGGPYQMMVVFSLESRRLDGRHTARVTTAFRRAVLSRAEVHIPALHGHHEGDVVQCAFLGLPFVQAEHADGHLLGVALAIPQLATADMAVINAALPSLGESMEVTAGPLGILTFSRLSPLDAQDVSWGLRAQRWEGPGRVWTTALPMVFDRFLPRNNRTEDDIERAVREAVENSGLPPPSDVSVALAPFVAGGLDLAPTDTLRRPTDTGFKAYRHVTLRFHQPVLGPVVVGSMRHYGLGLCVPIKGGPAQDG